MLTFRSSTWVGGSSTNTDIGDRQHRRLLTVILTFWVWQVDPRRWVRRLGFGALAAVVLQGLLGGLTVLWLLPDAVSIADAGLAQIFFCLTIALALFTSPGWRSAIPGGAGWTEDRQLCRVATATTAIIYVQILLGALVRHTGAGLAIPDFPLVFGGLLPPVWTTQIAAHYAHRIGALVAATGIVATAGHVWYHHSSQPALKRPAQLLLALLAVQILLGALVVLTRRNVAINTAHVATGALVLAGSLVLTLRSHRARFAGDSAGASDSVSPAFGPGLDRTSAGARA